MDMTLSTQGYDPTTQGYDSTVWNRIIFQAYILLDQNNLLFYNCLVRGFVWDRVKEGVSLKDISVSHYTYNN